MQAEDAAEMMDQERTEDRFKQWAAIGIGVLAMLLAITGLGGANAGKEATNNNIYAANFYSFYQAKYIRQTNYNLVADAIELAFLQTPGLSEQAKAELKAKPRPIATPPRVMNLSPRTMRARSSYCSRPRNSNKSAITR